MSDLIPDELEDLLCKELASGESFRLHFEYIGGELNVVLIKTRLHCATCQCHRTLNVAMPTGPKGIARKCSWHHD